MNDEERKTKRVVWVSKTRTILVEVFLPPAVAEVVRAEIPQLHVARRPSVAAVWGPPVTLHLE